MSLTKFKFIYSFMVYDVLKLSFFNLAIATTLNIKKRTTNTDFQKHINLLFKRSLQFHRTETTTKLTCLQYSIF